MKYKVRIKRRDGIRQRYWKSYKFETAWPRGIGQQRFKKITSKGFELESTAIPISTSNLPKTHRSPITEKEVKQIIESFTPEEIGTGPKQILITARGTPLGSYADTYGEAFRHGGIKLYSKPFIERKRGPSTYKVGREQLLADALHDMYLYDVVPHEIAHIRLKHPITKTPSSAEKEKAASAYAKEYRKKRGITEKEYYLKKTDPIFGAFIIRRGIQHQLR